MTNSLLTLFLPIIIGYILVKIKYLNSSLSRDIKLFVIRVAVPARIFTSMLETNLETIKQILPLSISYVLLTFLLILSTFFVFFKVKDNRTRAAYMIAITFGNYGYMGWAVLNQALGPEGLTRGVFFTSLWWPILYAGSFFIAKLTKVNSKLSIKSYILNMTVPTAILVVGIVVNLTKLQIYSPVLLTIAKFGDMTVTLILFSVGLTISFKDGFSYLKMALAPILLRPLLGVLCAYITILVIGIDDPLSRSTVLIESTMPVAVLSVVIGDMLGLDEKLLSSILVLSTLLSLLTIPLSILLF
jgi:hypothetical protein